MAIYQLKTFSDIYTAVLEELKIPSSDTTSLNRIKRDINLIYQTEVVPYEQWKWIRGYVNLTHQSYYSTGTVTVTQNSATITFSTAPGTSKKGHWFSAGGQEVYQIRQHTAASTTAYLESAYVGTTSSTATFKVWTDKIPLPVDCRETVQITHDYMSQPLESMGIHKFRQYLASAPKAEGRPRWYSTGDYVDPSSYSTISSIPASVSRSSAGIIKTLVFATTVASLLRAGDRIEVTSAGSYDYNGEFVVATVSTTTMTYTATVDAQESSTADTAFVVKLLNVEADAERYRELLVYPSVSSSKSILHVDYIKETVPLENDSDEPLMPLGDRVVLLYGALMRGWARVRNPEEAQRNAALYERKLTAMSGKMDDSVDFPVLKPDKTYLAAKRNSYRTRRTRFLPGDFGGSGSSSTSTPTSTASRVAIFDSTGALTASPTIDLNELSFINDAEVSSTVTLTDNTTTTAASWAHATYSHIFVLFSLSRGSGNRETGIIFVSTDGSSAEGAQASAPIGTLGVTFSADISSTDVRLRAALTSTGTNATMKYRALKW